MMVCGPATRLEVFSDVPQVLPHAAMVAAVTPSTVTVTAPPGATVFAGCVMFAVSVTDAAPKVMDDGESETVMEGCACVTVSVVCVLFATR